VDFSRGTLNESFPPQLLNIIIQDNRSHLREPLNIIKSKDLSDQRNTFRPADYLRAYRYSKSQYFEF
jgi:hypothetical protein